MKNLFKLISCFVILLSGIMSAQTNQIDPTFFKESIAITNAYARSINSREYVKEIQLQNYSKDKFNVQKISFQDLRLADDGKGNDKVANDGIYTSVETFTHNSTIQDTGGRDVSVLRSPIVDSTFKFAATGPVLTVTCDITFGTSGCRAEALGWCTKCCFSLSNCSTTFGWG